jgi:hypothetical protein
MATPKALYLTPSADVATDGTMVFYYGGALGSSDFVAGSEKLYAKGHQKLYSQASDTFTLVYSSTYVTVTWKASTSIPKGTEVALQLRLKDSGVDALTENAGAIGGTNDGNLPDLTANYTAITGSTGTADGAWDAVGATNSGDVSGAIKNNFAEVNAKIVQLVADDVALRAAVRENAAKINAILSRLQTAGVNTSV